MDLLCPEQVFNDSYDNDNYRSKSNNHSHIHDEQHVNRATIDPIFLQDRCLTNLLTAENKKNYIPLNFSKQREITPNMRKVVAVWMSEVCEENHCQEEVFLLSLSYMDRFLACTPIGKNHLQILAAACLLLASKLREPICRGLPVDLLVIYTDNSITRRDLIQWELVVLSCLKWDISSVTPLDFLDLLLSRLPIEHQNCPHIMPDKIREHAQAFIALAAKEHEFCNYSASKIAASSIAASLKGLYWHQHTNISIDELLDKLTNFTSVDQNDLQKCMIKLEDLFQKNSRQAATVFVNITAKTMLPTDVITISNIEQRNGHGGKLKESYQNVH